MSDIISDYIEIHEGRKHKVYRDPVKHLKTIGVGFNLEKNGAKEKIKALGLSYKKICDGKTVLTDKQINILLYCDIAQARRDAMRFCGDAIVYNRLTPIRKIVLIDMAFNLGYGALAKFVKLKKALVDQNWNKAADEMKDSKWYHQVKDRGEHDVYAMRYNQFHPGIKLGSQKSTAHKNSMSIFMFNPLWKKPADSTLLIINKVEDKGRFYNF